VDALDGGPGVRTRRYAGTNATDDENNAKLLGALEAVPPARRGAQYVCALALALPGVPEVSAVEVVTGTCQGRIAVAPRGAGGFGYDPIFEPVSEPPGGRTFGLYSAGEKNAISHRAAAARQMTPRLREIGF
jgi:XTP/dITP diphosphohydrolase